MKCPYCRSEDVVEYEHKANIGGGNIIKYRCYNCEWHFEERDIKGCGKQIFKYGDNYPVFNKGGEKMKFERGNKVSIRIGIGIYCKGEIIYADNRQNLYRVKYKKGHQYEEDIFKGEDLALIEDKNITPICPKCKNNNRTEASISVIYEWYCRKCNFWFNKKNENGNATSIKIRKDNIHHKLLENRKKFKNMGKVPKAKKDDLIDLWIDLWELLREKIKKEIKK